jgi:hypothetical protein
MDAICSLETRRAFMAIMAGGLLAAPLAAEAQLSKVAKVGILLYGTPQADPNLADLRRSLRELNPANSGGSRPR